MDKKRKSNKKLKLESVEVLAQRELEWMTRDCIWPNSITFEDSITRGDIPAATTALVTHDERVAKFVDTLGEGRHELVTWWERLADQELIVALNVEAKGVQAPRLKLAFDLTVAAPLVSEMVRMGTTLLVNNRTQRILLPVSRKVESFAEMLAGMPAK